MRTRIKGDVFDQRDAHEVVRCPDYGFLHVWPLPTEDSLAELYKEEYYTQSKIEKDAEDQDWQGIHWQDRFQVFEAQLAQDQRKILEIGCAAGFFLAYGEKRGWRGFGVEPSALASAYARDELGLQVHTGLFEAFASSTGERFDVIHMEHVLEHVLDPVEVLGLARHLLEPGGLISIIVPNDYNPVQRVAREREQLPNWWVVPEHHLNYFDHDSLGRVLETTGYELVDRSTSFPMDLFLAMGRHYVGNGPLGRQCHLERVRLETGFAETGQLEKLHQLYRSMAQVGIGRDVVMVARKTN